MTSIQRQITFHLLAAIRDEQRLTIADLIELTKHTTADLIEAINYLPGVLEAQGFPLKVIRSTYPDSVPTWHLENPNDDFSNIQRAQQFVNEKKYRSRLPNWKRFVEAVQRGSLKVDVVYSKTQILNRAGISDNVLEKLCIDLATNRAAYRLKQNLQSRNYTIKAVAHRSTANR